MKIALKQLDSTAGSAITLICKIATFTRINRKIYLQNMNFELTGELKCGLAECCTCALMIWGRPISLRVYVVKSSSLQHFSHHDREPERPYKTLKQ